MHNKKGASPLPLRLTEVRPSTRMYRNRTWEHTPNGVYPQHPFPDIHLIGRFQLRANSGKYHFKTKINKSVRFPKKRGHQRQKSCSGRSRRATGSLHRNAVRGYGGAGCRVRDAGRGVRRVPMRGSEKCRCRAQKSVGTGAGAGADRTGPSGQRLRTRRPRRRARPTV